MQNLCHALTALTDRLCLTQRVACSRRHRHPCGMIGHIPKNSPQGSIIEVLPNSGGCAVDTMVVSLVHGRALMEQQLSEVEYELEEVLQLILLLDTGDQQAGARCQLSRGPNAVGM